MSSTVLTVGSIIVGILFTLFGYQIVRERKEAAREAVHTAMVDSHVKALNRIPEIEHKLDMLQGQTEVYFGIIDKYVAAAIHSPIHTERDALMEKLEKGQLTLSEAERLLSLIQRMEDEELDPNKKLASVLAEARMTSMVWRMRKEKETALQRLNELGECHDTRHPA